MCSRQACQNSNEKANGRHSSSAVHCQKTGLAYAIRIQAKTLGTLASPVLDPVLQGPTAPCVV